MKIRNGFVSNSSSSSFIVGFPQLPKSKDELKEMLFGEQEWYFDPFDIDGQKWSTDEIAQIVWDDLHIATSTEVERAITIQMPDGSYRLPFAEFTQIKNTLLVDKLKEVKQYFEGLVLSVFNYADEDGDLGSAMEHGSLFANLKHMRFSKH